MKKLLLTLLATLLVPLTIWADEWTDPETNVVYTYTPGQSEASVKSGNQRKPGSPDVTGDIAILDKFTLDGNEYTVTSIGECAFWGRLQLTSVIIPNSVTSIEYGAFTRCSGLTSVTIPNSVTSIEENAFYGCSGLTSVTIPNSVTIIGGGAFEDCSGLTSVTIPNSVTSIEGYAFKGCSGLTSVTIGNSVTSIGEDAFYGCSGLKAVYISDLDTWCKISFNGSWANPLYYAKHLFVGEEEVTDVVIPNSVTSIGNSIFSGCSGLTSIVIPNSVTSIEENAFYGCSGLTSVTIPESVTSIGSGAFSVCSGLTSVTIPESVTSIESVAFSGCSGLTSVTIGNSVTSIGAATFYDCSGLTSVTIGNSVTSIGKGAFSGCSGLTSITIPESVTSIGWNAFEGCNGLQAVYISDLDAWCKISFTNYMANPLYFAKHLFVGEEEVTDMVIPNSVTSIGEFAFYGCSGLTSVTIPESVTSIGVGAFADCSGLTSVTIPNSVTSIGDFAFEGCSGLTSVTSLIATPFKIDSSVFSVFKTATLYVPDSSIGLYQATSSWSSFATILPIGAETTSVSLEIQDEAGHAVSGDVSITWYDEDREQIGVGITLGGVKKDTTVYYSVALGEELGRVYREVSYRKAVADGNPVVCQLEKIPSVTLCGQVMAMGHEVALADVTVTQWLNGKYEQTLQTQTDGDGRFAVEAKNDSTELLVQHSGYADYRLNRLTLGSGDVGTLYMEPVQGKVLQMALSYQPVAAQGVTPTVEDWYTDTRNVEYTLYNNTKGVALTDYTMQQGNIVLPTGADTGDCISVTAHSLNGRFADATAEATIASNDTAQVSLRLVAYGGVEVSYSQKSDDQLLAMLYDGAGRLVGRTTFAGYTTAFSNLAAGAYTLVTMGYSGSVGTPATLDDLGLIGLAAGTDYSSDAVTVADGYTTTLYVGSVPELDASKFEYTSASTSYLPNKTQFTVGQFAVMAARVAFMPEYQGQVSDVRLTVTIPDNCAFVDNSVVVGNSVAPYTLNGNRLTIPLSQEELDSRVLFCLLPTQGGSYTSTAYAEFNCYGERTQAIGSAAFEATGGTIFVPSATREKIITVSGVAMPKAEVHIYDGEHLMATTRAKADGTWRTDCELHNAYNLSTHEVYAQYQSAYHQTMLTTSTKECLYDINSPVAKSVTMSFYNGWMKKNVDVTFDFEKSTTSSNSYSFYTATDFTFVADLTANNNTSVNGVTFYVFTTQNDVRKLTGFFDEKQSRWVAVSKFDSNCLPVNVSVDVEVNGEEKEVLVDRNMIDDTMADVALKAAEVKAEAEEIENVLSMEVEPTQDAKIYQELGQLLSQPDYDQARVDYLISIILSKLPETDREVSDEEMERLEADFDSHSQEMEAWFQYQQSEGKDELLKELMIDPSILSDEMPTSGSLYGGDGMYEYNIENISSVNRDELLAEGYSEINMTDGSRLYCLLSDNLVVYIDEAKGTKCSILLSKPANARMNAPQQYLVPDCFETIQNLFSSIQPNADSRAEWANNVELIKQIMDGISCTYSSVYTFIMHRVREASRLEKLNSKIAYEEKMLETYKDALRRKQHMPAYVFEHMNCTVKNLCRLKAERDGLNKVFVAIGERLRQFPNAINPSAPLGKGLRALGRVGGGLGILVDLYDLGSNCFDAVSDIQGWLGHWAEIERKIPCEGNEERALSLRKSVILNTIGVSRTYLNVIRTGLGKTAVDVASLLNPEAGLPLFVASLYLGITTDVIKTWGLDKYFYRRLQLSDDIWKLNCQKEEEPDDNPDEPDNKPKPQEEETVPKDDAPEPKTKSTTPIHDPSGYVYEAVTSNRLAGVTATIYEQQTGFVAWDAEEYSQVNPQVTDETGLYRWDVPQGQWQVRFVKDGYEPQQTEWLPVPPPQLEVNMPMVQAVAPTVVKAHGTESGITLTFSKYMKPATVEASGSVTAVMDTPSALRTEAEAMAAGDAVKGMIEMGNLEEDPYTGLAYASEVRLVPTTTPLRVGDVVLVTVKKDVESYCSVPMDVDQTLRVVIEPEMAIGVQPEVVVDYGSSMALEVAVSPAEAMAGKVVLVESATPMIASVSLSELTLDAEGKGVVTIGGELPGSTSVRLRLADSDLEAETMVSVVLAERQASTPKASKPSGSTVAEGFLLKLTTATQGATIYYTLDDSDPATSETRMTYDQPITITGNTTVKAIATRQGIKDSKVATFVYEVEGTPVAVSGVASTHNVTISYSDGYVVVGGAEGASCRVYDTAGRELAHRERIGAAARIRVSRQSAYIVSLQIDGEHALVRKIAAQ